MPHRSLLRPCLLLSAIAVAITACAPGPPPEPEEPEKPPEEEPPKDPGALQEAGRYAEAAEAYGARAEDAEGAQAARLRYRQARALALAGEDPRAREVLQRLEDTEVEAKARLLRARIHLRHRRYDEARPLLEDLAAVRGEATLPNGLREEALDYLAQLHLARRQPGPAFDTLVERHRLLEEGKREPSLTRIRYVLGAIPEKLLEERIDAAGTDFPAGYLRFERLMRRATRQALAQTKRELNGWLERYGEHPLAAIVRNRLQRVQEAPLRLAVLLPLDSRYGSVAEALLQGMLAGYYQTDRGAGISVEVFDTRGSAEGLRGAVAKVREGEFAAIIGPLTQAGARTLSGRDESPENGDNPDSQRAPSADSADAEAPDEEDQSALAEGLPPTLLLNTTRDWARASQNLFQLGLDPEEEARQVAEFAYQQGHRQGGVLYPDSDWGRRMVRAFQARWQELTGTTRALHAFDPDETDHSPVLQELLALDEVAVRERGLKETLGIDLPEYETPPHREDLDFLFLASETRSARLIQPQLEFFAAGDIPLLATSHVHDPSDTRSDRQDMDGIRFLQLPWFLDPLPRHARAAEALGDSYPDQGGSLERIQALGYDAYTLTVGAWRRSLLLDEPQGEALRRMQMEGGTGRLTVTEQGRVQRNLQWAEYQNGRIFPLPGMLGPGS